MKSGRIKRHRTANPRREQLERRLRAAERSLARGRVNTRAHQMLESAAEQENDLTVRQFHQALRVQDPALGLRDVNDVADCAAHHGLALEGIVEMPANNRSLIFRWG